MAKKSSGTSEGAGGGVERPEDADAEGAEQADGKGSSDDDDDPEGEGEKGEGEKAEAAPTKKAVDRDDDDDDDDDDHDDDDDDDDSERAEASKPAPAKSAGSAPAKAQAVSERPSTGRKRAAEAQNSLAPTSEDEIDSPSKQTLGMLGVVAAATLVMWSVGRAECNYNEVGEGMKPREVSIEERTRTPKDLAFAFEYALSGYDFATARKLSTGDAKKLVEERERACKAAGCEEKRKLLGPKVASVSELLKRTANHALTRVWSEGGEISKKHFAVLKREGRGWLVESYRPDDGAPVELPGDTAAPTSAHPSTAPVAPAPGLPPGASSVMPPGHPPVPGYGLDPHHGIEGPSKLPGSGAPKPPAAGVRPPAPGGIRPTAPAPGAAPPAPQPGAAKPPAPTP